MLKGIGGGGKKYKKKKKKKKKCTLRKGEKD